MPGAHATFSPSAAKRGCNCPPSVLLNKKYTDLFGEKTSEFAEEGTLAHSVAELKLRKENGEINEFSYEEQRKALGDIPTEMDHYTDEYVDTVLAELYQCRKTCPDAALLIEVRLDMRPKVQGCWGTSDAVIVSDDLLIVIDLKYGSGVPVSAEGNPQARLYAFGAYEGFKDLYDFKMVKEIIVQPRLGSITDETLSTDQLVEWVESYVVEPAKLAARGEGEFKCGDWCRWCNVKAICKENVMNSLSVLRNVFDSPDVIPDDLLVQMIPFFDIAESWMKEVRGYVLAQALQGKQYKGYKLIKGTAPRRKWLNGDDVIDQLSRAGYSPEQYESSPELMSPSAVQKAIGKKAFDALLSQFVVQGDPPPKLVPEGTKGEDYVITGMFDDLD